MPNGWCGEKQALLLGISLAEAASAPSPADTEVESANCNKYQQNMYSTQTDVSRQ